VFTIRNKQRFDDVGPMRADGFYEYVYRGYYYEIVAAERIFHIRTYDDQPGVAIVVRPTDARTSPDLRQLVDFITTTLGCAQIKLYAPNGAYRFVDIRTLEFVAG
jgi:hypothetical protein